MYFTNNGELIANYRSSQIIKDYKNFCKKVKKNFPDATFDTEGEDLIIIHIPSDYQDFSDCPKLREKDNVQIDLLMDTLDLYESEIINKKMSAIEIIPLKGYPIESITEDVKNAVDKKLTICVIDNYRNYQKFNSGLIRELNYTNYKYLSDEYCNVVCYCLKGDLDGLTKYCSSNLTLGNPCDE